LARKIMVYVQQHQSFRSIEQCRDVLLKHPWNMFSGQAKMCRVIKFLFASALFVTSTHALAQTHALVQGWNLEGNDNATVIEPDTFFGNATTATSLTPSVASVWTWDKNAFKWNFFTPAMTPSVLSAYASPKGYSVLTAIPQGQGFWIKANNSVTVNLASSAASVATHTLVQGWNLEGNNNGAVIDPNLIFGNTTSTTALSPDVMSVWTWDKNFPRWNFFTPAMSPSDLSAYAALNHYGVLTSIQPGEGFWVNAKNPVSFPASDGLVWSDEFNGTNIDTTKWAFDLGNGPSNPGPLYGWGNGEMESYTSSTDNIALQNGTLVITARRQDWGGQPFTSARLVTRGKYSFRQGRFVARIKMPEGNRMWPAFWLLGDVVDDWPKSGEIDIAEMFAGTVGRGDNASFATAHWWDEAISQHAMNGATFTNQTKLSADFHDYELVWDEHYMRGKIDGFEYWVLDISGSAMSELRNNSYYIVLNLAVGSPNFGMTSASQANGPLPQNMSIDYVRVYSSTGSTMVDEVASQPHGLLGILADGTLTAAQIDPAKDANLLLWNNLTSISGLPYAGATSIAVQTTNSNSWFGFGYAATKRRNLLNYAAGYLNFSLKTTSTDAFKVGINGGNDGDAWVSFINGSDPYGFLRDGTWHQVSIPMNRFNNADFTDIRQFFMVASDDSNGLKVGASQKYEFDEIFWSENAPENMAHPVGTQFGIYTERLCDAGNFNTTTDGDIFIWNKSNGVLTSAAPFEGKNASTFTAPSPQWYGMGFTPKKLYDLSAFKNGHLHIALKVPANVTSDFKIGIKSPGGTAVRESWIKFKNGADPYGMLRDGNYHQLSIPASDFNNSDFSALAILFMIAGDGPSTVIFDDVYWTTN
jgi:beta-glucanase (GH16 family)